MGINAELVSLVAGLRNSGILQGKAVTEIGAQDVCVVDEAINNILQESGFGILRKKVESAKELYSLLGFSEYQCIDATGAKGALLYDLNEDLRKRYSCNISSDLVTNLGTAEHCFDQRAVFKNIHDLCKPGGVMIHALPVQGNVNHGFYSYHPRFFADLAAANQYEVIDLSFTVDYKPALIRYSKNEFQKWGSHDLLFYAVFRRINDTSFSLPFDGMFASANRLAGYEATGVDPLVTEFAPYLKGGSWENTKGLVGSNASGTMNRVKTFFRRLFSARE